MHVCKRCHYSTNTKCNLVNHLSRQKPCDSTYSDVECQALLFELRGVKVEDAKDKRISELEAIVSAGNMIW